MVSIDSFPSETLWQEDTFRFIKPNEFREFGINPADIPLGTFAALKHPPQLQSRFGGNAYGFGIFEVHDRLKPEDTKLLQAITFEDPGAIRKNFEEINEIYKKIGLLIRFSSLGKPYYLIPTHLISNTLTHIKSKVEEICKIIGFHRKKYLKEYLKIGLVAHQDDLIARELSFRFKEHGFIVLDSIKKLQDLNQTLDLVILTTDLYEIILMKKFSSLIQEGVTRKLLEQYSIYLLWKVYNLLKSDGEIFVIADQNTPKTNRTTRLVFKTEQEEKNFLLFSHIFKTRKKYKTKDKSIEVNIFDFQKYLSGLYVEQEVIDKILAGKRLDEITLKQITDLPYLNFQLADWPLLSSQEKSWSGVLPIYFEKIFLKPLIPQLVREGWENRFTFADYSPNYMIIYLGQKKPLKTTMSMVMQDVIKSRLIGCPLELLADYRNSFEYVIRTLMVLDELKKKDYKSLPQIFMDRLTQPLENKNRRFNALNDVIKLVNKIKGLEKIRGYLNPDNIEGLKTDVFKNLEALTFFGFGRGELKEIIYIVLGHTALGRIISGKINEKSLKPVTDLARTYNAQQALNLLRYCRLMTMAETKAARGTELTQGELTRLFDLYESTVRVIINRDLDWDGLLDEKTSSAGGIHNRIIQKLLMMMNHFEFLDNWSELRQKGQMEKESLADYDDRKLSRIENVIKLVDTIEQFEEMYLRLDPLQLPVYYRKFFNIEFHGTTHLFERMDCELAFILIWITVNITQSEIINFNPILAYVEKGKINDWVEKIEKEAMSINIRYLDLAILREFSNQLYQSKSSFIMGTGFKLEIDPTTQALEVAYMDMDKDIAKVNALSKKLAGSPIAEISIEDLKNLEVLFSSLESFHQSHRRLLDQTDLVFRIPARQERWFQKVQNLRDYLRSNFLKVLFRPEYVYTDLDLLYRHAPSLLDFILPEFAALQKLDISWHLYLKSPVVHYIISATRKLQALIRHDMESFQNTHVLHALAQREFGPMATGIVGVSESQFNDLEKIVESLSHNLYLINALTKSCIFQDIGRVPKLREKYKNEINPADLAHTGALFLEKEKIAQKYNLDNKSKNYLIFLVKNHSLLHHIVRGEFSSAAIQEVIKSKDKELFEAFFVFSFIMLSAIREDLILEDLAGDLFQMRIVCHRIIDGETTLEAASNEDIVRRGALFYALESYLAKGLPEGVTPADFLEYQGGNKVEQSECISAGKMIFALERLFRLHGIRYVEFIDLVNLILKVPLKFIHKKRQFSNIGYATFEKEVFEAFRIYNTLQGLEEPIRHFILDKLVDDKVRIFGYEKVSGYLSYENQIKLLLIGLLGSDKFKANGAPICLNFLEMCEKIEKRYEAVNDILNTLSIEKLWDNKYQLNHFFKAKTGLILKKEKFPNVLSIDCRERFNVSQKISYMNTIKDVDQLKKYFHYSLLSLRKNPFYLLDYELQLEKAFEERLTEITDMILNQTKKQMGLINDFNGLHNLLSELLDQSWDIGFSDDQKQRLKDLYEIRKDSLKRNKLSEIDSMLVTVGDINELRDYWDSIKWYLQSNRQFFGKEFENLVAQKFDEKGSILEM